MSTTTRALFLLLPLALVGCDRVSKNNLVRPAGSPDGDARGSVTIRSRVTGSQRFSLELRRVDPDQYDYTLYLEDYPGSGVLYPVGRFHAHPFKYGRAKLSFDTLFGQSLPFGVDRVADLRGRSMEVVDDLDRTILLGVVPGLRGRRWRSTSFGIEE